MGADRTSIHRPEYCLRARAGTIDRKNRGQNSHRGAQPYELPVMKWVAMQNSWKLPMGKNRKCGGVYVFWFVADNEQTTGQCAASM